MARLSKSQSILPFRENTAKRTQRLLSQLDARQVKKAKNIHETYADEPKAERYAKDVADYGNLETDQPFYESWKRQKKIIQDKSGENRLIHEKRRLSGKTEKFIQGRLAGQGEDTPEAYVSRIRKTRGGKTIDTTYDAQGELVSKNKIRSHGRFKENWERDTNGELIRTHFFTRRLRDGVVFRKVEYNLGKLEDGKRTLVQKRGRSSKTFERDEATGKLTLVGRKGLLSEKNMTLNSDGSVQRLYRNRFARRPMTVTFLKAATDPVTNQPKPMMKTIKKTRFGRPSIRTVPLTESELAQQQQLKEAKSALAAQRNPVVAEQTSSLPTNTSAPPPVSHSVPSKAPVSTEPATATHVAPTPPVVPTPDARLTPFVSPAPVPPTPAPERADLHTENPAQAHPASTPPVVPTPDARLTPFVSPALVPPTPTPGRADLHTENPAQTHTASTPPVVPTPDARLTPLVSPAPVPPTPATDRSGFQSTGPASSDAHTAARQETGKPSHHPSTPANEAALKASMASVGDPAAPPFRPALGHVAPSPMAATSAPANTKAGSIHRLNQPTTAISPTPSHGNHGQALAALMASATPASAGSSSRSSTETLRNRTASSTSSISAPASTAPSSPSSPTRSGSIHRLGSSGTANTPGSPDGKAKTASLDATPSGDGAKTSAAPLTSERSRFAGRVVGASTYATNPAPPVMQRTFDRMPGGDLSR